MISRAIKRRVNLLKELNALIIVHDRPDVTEAAVVDGTFDDDGEDTGEHEAELNHVCPHHGLHTTLQTTHRLTGSRSTGHTQRLGTISVPVKYNIATPGNVFAAPRSLLAT